MSYIAKKYALSAGVGVSEKRLPSFDKALLDAKVGNYNLVRLSSILPADCKEIDINDIAEHIEEGSLLPTAYSTISSNRIGQRIVSTIGVGIPKDKSRVGVIMEFSAVDMGENDALKILDEMIEEAFAERGWEIGEKKTKSAFAVVDKNATFTTFACISEW